MLGYKGVSRDSAGAILGNCTMRLFLASSDTLLQTVTSDSSGNFYFSISSSGPHYITAYKSGSPDVVGSTARTLEPASFELDALPILIDSQSVLIDGLTIQLT